jgi:hypothetical protein
VTAFALVRGKLAAGNFNVGALAKLIAIRREIEADAKAKAFDQDFAALLAEIAPVENNAYDPQKRRAYADLSALVDAVGGLVAANGFALTFDAAPGATGSSPHPLSRRKLGCIVAIMTDAMTAEPTGAISRLTSRPISRRSARRRTLGSPRGIVRLTGICGARAQFRQVHQVKKEV